MEIVIILKLRFNNIEVANTVITKTVLNVYRFTSSTISILIYFNTYIRTMEIVIIVKLRLLK